MGIFSSIFGGLFSNGAAFSNGRITPFASGGIVSSPTIFPFANGIGLMGEAGAEAIMPLKRLSNGSLGVKAEGGGGTNITNQVNVTVQGSTGDSNKDNAYAQKVGNEVSKQMRALIIDELRVQMRPGNMLNPVGRN
jgi:phage-related minor tail protein